MTTLLKPTRTGVTPGSPATPGTPGTPAAPAYTYVSSYTYQPDYSGWHFEQRLISLPGAVPAVYQNVWVPPPGPIQYIRTPIYTTVPATVGTPPTPGTPAVPGAVFTDYLIGWNSSARSVGQLFADGALEFSVPASVVGTVVGLGYQYVGAGYANIDFGLYASHGAVTVMERGAATGATTSFVGTDVFRVQRRGRSITYLKNGTLFYTSLTLAPTGDLMAVASIYAGGDEVDGAVLQGALVGTAGADVGLQPLRAYAYNGSTHTEANATLLPLTAAAGGHGTVGMSVSAQPLTSLASNYAYAGCNATLLPLIADAGGGLLTPSFAASSTQWPLLLTAAHGLTGETGTGAATAIPLYSRGADHNYAEGVVSLLPLRTGGGRYPIFTGAAWLTLTGPYTLSGRGAPLAPNSFTASMPKFGLSAFGGGTACLVAKKPTLVATGTVALIGRAGMTTSAPTLVASGMGGGLLRAQLTLRAPYGIRAFSGGVAYTTVRAGYRLTMNGRAGGLGRAALNLPLYRLTAAGTTRSLSAARLLMPALRTVSSGRARLSAPSCTLIAAGTATVTADYEAYAVNLLVAPNAQSGTLPGYAVTRFSRYPFDRIVRYLDHYYGIGADGLYLLEGDTDGTLPIAWVARTALSDFGSKQLKGIDAVYVNARLAATVTATVVVGEKGTNTYRCNMQRGANTQNHRCTTGKGIRSTHFAIELSDVAGAAAEINSIDLRINEHKRAV